MLLLISVAAGSVGLASTYVFENKEEENADHKIQELGLSRLSLRRM